MKNLIIYFITGGLFTALIVFLEQSGLPLLSGIATIMPIFTLVSYIFIGQSHGGGLVVSRHALFVFWGTIVAWMPYMLTVVYLAPKIGSTKAIVAGLVVFFILAVIFTLAVSHYKLFQ